MTNKPANLWGSFMAGAFAFAVVALLAALVVWVWGLVL